MGANPPSQLVLLIRHRQATTKISSESAFHMTRGCAGNAVMLTSRSDFKSNALPEARQQRTLCFIAEETGCLLVAQIRLLYRLQAACKCMLNSLHVCQTMHPPSHRSICKHESINRVQYAPLQVVSGCQDTASSRWLCRCCTLPRGNLCPHCQAQDVKGRQLQCLRKFAMYQGLGASRMTRNALQTCNKVEQTSCQPCPGQAACQPRHRRLKAASTNKMHIRNASRLLGCLHPSGTGQYLNRSHSAAK